MYIIVEVLGEHQTSDLAPRVNAVVPMHSQVDHRVHALTAPAPSRQ